MLSTVALAGKATFSWARTLEQVSAAKMMIPEKEWITFHELVLGHFKSICEQISEPRSPRTREVSELTEFIRVVVDGHFRKP
jgi:endonuclease III